MKQIVCLSTSPWYPIPTRKQQVMSRIEDAQILYFDPPVSILAPLKDPQARKRIFAYRKPAQTVAPNLQVFALPPVLPFFNRYRILNKLNQRRIARFVRKKMAEQQMLEPVLWTYSPTSCDCVDRIPHKALVYDCVDRHSAYGGLMNPAVVDEMELELAKKADMVFATAQGLQQRLKQVNETASFIPNGANFERFSQAAEPQKRPEDFPPSGRPRLWLCRRYSGLHRIWLYRDCCKGEAGMELCPHWRRKAGGESLKPQGAFQRLLFRS